MIFKRNYTNKSGSAAIIPIELVENADVIIANIGLKRLGRAIDMKHHKIIHNSKGFTLVEIIVVLIILGILGSIAVSRYIDLETSSKRRAIEGGIAQLNGTESLTWANQKISSIGYIDDEKLREAIDYNLGREYAWDNGPDKDRGTLNFLGESVPLLRTESTASQPGVWRRASFP